MEELVFMKRKSKILSLILSLVFVFAIGFTACGGGNGDTSNSGESQSSITSSSSSTAGASSSSSKKSYATGGSSKKLNITFYGDGSDTETKVFKNLVEDYNKLGKKVNGKTVNVEYRAVDSVSSAISTTIGTEDCPTVFYVGDGQYKEYVESGFLADLTDFVEGENGIDYTQMWDSIYDRYYYSTENHRSGKDAKNGRWYGMPKDIGPTVMFYNEDQLNAAGIRVISVAKEDLDRFNNGETFYRGFEENGLECSKTAVYKMDWSDPVAINGTVGDYGYFVDGNGNKFINNKIAMSWEEIREVARILNANNGTGYLGGYFTEWWFNYGWSVGGNCIQYVETTDSTYSGGFYDFTLVDDTKNFIVADDCTDGITVNGTHYNAGEIISYNDKLTNELDLAGSSYNQVRSDRAVYDSAIGYNGEANNTVIASGKLKVLPSQREAFTEFVRLSTDADVSVDGVNGYAVSAKPTAMGGDGAKSGSFLGQKINFLVDGRWNVTSFRNTATFAWDVAPLPIYKAYNNTGVNTGDPSGFGMNRTVINHGVTAGHSGSVALAVSAMASSNEKAAAWDFIKYIAGEEGQIRQSKQGFAIPSQKHIAMDTEHGYFLNQKDVEGYMLPPYNAEIFIEAAMHEGEGDWSYLKTGSAWIDKWAQYLNNQVRNGTKSFNEFINSADFTDTFNVIKEYTKAKLEF